MDTNQKNIFWTVDNILDYPSNVIQKDFLSKYLTDGKSKAKLSRQDLDGYIQSFVKANIDIDFETELKKVAAYLNNGHCFPDPDISSEQLQFFWYMVEAYVLSNPEIRKDWGEDPEKVPYHSHWLCQKLNEAHEIDIAFVLAAVTLSQTHFSPETTRIIKGPPGSWFFQNSEKDFINLDRHAMMGLGVMRSLIIDDHEIAHAKHSHVYPQCMMEAYERSNELYEKSKKEQLSRKEYWEYLNAKRRYEVLFGLWNTIEDNLVDYDALQDRHNFETDIPEQKKSDFNFLMLMMNGIDRPEYMQELEDRVTKEDKRASQLTVAEKQAFQTAIMWERRLMNLSKVFLFPIGLKTGMFENKPDHWKKMRIRLDWITDDPDALPMDENPLDIPDSAYDPSDNQYIADILNSMLYADPDPPSHSDIIDSDNPDDIFNAVFSGLLVDIKAYIPPTMRENAIIGLRPNDQLKTFGSDFFKQQCYAHAERRAEKINRMMCKYGMPIVDHVIEAELAKEFPALYADRIDKGGHASIPVDDLCKEMSDLVGDHADALKERLGEGKETNSSKSPRDNDLEQTFKDAAEKAASDGHRKPGYADVDGLGHMPMEPPPGLGRNGYDQLEAEMKDYINYLVENGMTLEQLSQMQDHQGQGGNIINGARNPLLPSPGHTAAGGFFSRLEVLDWTQDWNACVAKVSSGITRIEDLLKDIQDVQWQAVITDDPNLNLLPKKSLRVELSLSRLHKLAVKTMQGTATFHDHRLMEVHPPEPIPVETIIFQMGDGSGSMGRYSEVVSTPMGAVIQVMCMFSQACENLIRDPEFRGRILNYAGAWGPDWNDKPQSPPLLFKPWDSPEQKRDRIGAFADGLASGTSAGPSCDRIIHTIVEDQNHFGRYMGHVHAVYYSDGDIYDKDEFLAKTTHMFESIPYFTLSVMTINPKRTNQMAVAVESLQRKYGDSKVRYVHCTNAFQASDQAVNLVMDIVRTHESLVIMPTNQVVLDYKSVLKDFQNLRNLPKARPK